MPRSVDFFFLVNYKEKEKYFSYPRKCFLGLTFAIFKAARKLRVSKGQGKNVGENKNQNGCFSRSWELGFFFSDENGKNLDGDTKQ